jgi:hypothetical protein
MGSRRTQASKHSVASGLRCAVVRHGIKIVAIDRASARLMRVLIVSAFVFSLVGLLNPAAIRNDPDHLRLSDLHLALGHKVPDQ